MMFQEYLDQRYTPQLRWYDAKSLYNHRMYMIYQTAIVLCATINPVLAAYLEGRSQGYLASGHDCTLASSHGWLTVAISTIVAILVGLHNILKYQEKWLRQRSSCERLKREFYCYELGAGGYDSLSEENRQKLFVDRAETIVAEEQTDWIKEHGKKADIYAS